MLAVFDWVDNTGRKICRLLLLEFSLCKSNRKAMNRNWSNKKANPAHKTKAGNK